MNDASLYRAVWRWHFYAGIIILPVLAWLAVTGGLYLYKPEIERFVYRGWIELSAPSNSLPVSMMMEAVENSSAVHIVDVSRPSDRADSWRMTGVRPDGERRTFFVDPASGDVLGSTGEGGIMLTVRNLHSLMITGPIGNAIVEIAAGWAIVLVVTGFYLWWPRAGQKAVALRGRLHQRRFWRDLHASTGALVGLVVLFLAVTGLPWSVFWGSNLQSIIAAGGLGQPEAPGRQPWEKAGGHQGPTRSKLPWSMQARTPPVGHGHGDIGPDRAVAIAAESGLRAPWLLVLPADHEEPYLVSATVDRAQDVRAIYIEASSGKILHDADFRQFGIGAQAIEWGIRTHQGQQYGELNRLVMLVGCLAVLLLAASAPVLWWKRRKNGRLREPPRPANAAKMKGVTAIMLVIGAVFPLTGATMLVALFGESMIRARVAR